MGHPPAAVDAEGTFEACFPEADPRNGGNRTTGAQEPVDGRYAGQDPRPRASLLGSSDRAVVVLAFRALRL